MNDSFINEQQSSTALIELGTVNVNPDLPLKQRIDEFIRQINDPYYFRSGKYKIKSSFRKNGPSIEDILISMRR